MTETSDHYKILQVDAEADLDVIQAAHRVLAGRLRPENDPTGDQYIQRAELDRALAVLSDPHRREAYDQQRAHELVAVGPGYGSAAGHGPAAHGAGHDLDEVPRLAHGALTERLLAGKDGANLANMEIDFGRYAGWTLLELARQDPDYLRWLARHSSGLRYRGAILRLLAEADTERIPLNVQR